MEHHSYFGSERAIKLGHPCLDKFYMDYSLMIPDEISAHLKRQFHLLRAVTKPKGTLDGNL